MLKDLTELRVNNQIANPDILNDFFISDSFKKSLISELGESKYIIDDYTSYTVTDNNKYNVAIIPNQYFILASEMFDLATEVYKYFEIFEELRLNAEHLLGSSTEIESNIRAGKVSSKKLVNDDDIRLFACFLDKADPAYRLDGKRLVDDKGKARSSRDCFGSIILKNINLPDSSSTIFGSLVYDLVTVGSVYSELTDHYLNQKKTRKIGVEILSSERNPSLNALGLSKPFLLLAGISGTGKTRFVKDQARRSAPGFGLKEGENYCLVPVRPDWHEPSDLLGYISRLNGVQYVATDFLKFVFKALCAAISDIKNAEIIWKTTDKIPPFWLCLDEMNLAPVEQYFADYLSVIETREWDGDSYKSEALLKKGIFDSLKPKTSFGGGYDATDNSGSPLGMLFHEVFSGISINEDLKPKIIDYVTKNGLMLPPNLIVAGTVNMDETTHGFSRKVIDRALTFDFGRFFPNDFDTFFNPESDSVLLSFPVNSQADQNALSLVAADSDGGKSIEFLKAVNKVLKGTPFELAYRALNELLLSVISFSPKDDTELQSVWDDFMMCKVLPRIDGDSDKLAVVDPSNTDGTILDQLANQLQEQLSNIWDGNESRPDLLRESKISEEAILIGCRSNEKIDWMKDRLEKNTFTSFWP